VELNIDGQSDLPPEVDHTQLFGDSFDSIGEARRVLSAEERLMCPLANELIDNLQNRGRIFEKVNGIRLDVIEIIFGKDFCDNKDCKTNYDCGGSCPKCDQYTKKCDSYSAIGPEDLGKSPPPSYHYEGFDGKACRTNSGKAGTQGSDYYAYSLNLKQCMDHCSLNYNWCNGWEYLYGRHGHWCELWQTYPAKFEAKGGVYCFRRTDAFIAE